MHEEEHSHKPHDCSYTMHWPEQVAHVVSLGEQVVSKGAGEATTACRRRQGTLVAGLLHSRDR